MGTADADVYKFLKYFTFLSVDEIDALERADAAREGRPEAQAVLAKEVTRLVHGDSGLAAAERITDALFSGDATQLSASDLAQRLTQGQVPRHGAAAPAAAAPTSSMWLC